FIGYHRVFHTTKPSNRTPGSSAPGPGHRSTHLSSVSLLNSIFFESKMSNKRKRIKTDNQATSRVYTEVEYQALKDEIVQLKQAVDEHCGKETDLVVHFS